MPIEYAASGGGVLKEHAAVREAVGVFDVSHLGKATVRGAGARAFVNACLSNDLDRIGAGQAQYTLCCDESGGVVDDLIAYLVDDDEVFLVPNAANTAEVVRRLAAAAPEGIEVTDQHRDFGVLAVQGPRSADVLARLGLPSDQDYMAYADADWDGRPVRDLPHRLHRRARLRTDPALGRRARAVGRAGRRGARARAACRPASAPATRCAPRWATRCTGRTSRSTSRRCRPRSGWAVGWKKPTFWGRDALLAEKADGPAARAARPRVPRPRHSPRAHAGAVSGR